MRGVQPAEVARHGRQRLLSGVPPNDAREHRRLRENIFWGLHPFYSFISNFPEYCVSRRVGVVFTWFYFCWFGRMSLVMLNLTPRSLGLRFEFMSEETPGDVSA